MMTRQAIPDISLGRSIARVAASSAGAFLCLAAFSLGGSSAFAQTQAAAPGLAQNFAADSSKPVDIDAEALEVDDKKKTATFKGKVNVVQGDFKLQANTIVVHYVNTDKSATGAVNASAPAAAPAASPMGAGSGGADITTIDAVGSVVVNNNRSGQSITGDRANFDVKKQIVVVENHVVVTQGETVLRGDRLTANTIDGTYKMDAMTRADASGGKPEGSGRLQMRIIPGQVKDQWDQQKKQDAAKAEAKPKAETKPAKRKPAQAPADAQKPAANSWATQNPDQ